MTTAFRTEEDNQSGAISFKNTDNITLKTTGPELLGVPKAPTAVVNTNTTQIATTEFVGVAIANAVATGGVQPSNASPMPDGVAVAGTSALYSRGDHVHPDSTKFVKLVGDTMSGALNINSNLAVSGTATIGSTLTVSQPINANRGINVSNSGIAMGGYNSTSTHSMEFAGVGGYAGSLGSIQGVNSNGSWAGVVIDAGASAVEFSFRNSGIGYSPGGWQTGSDARLKSNVEVIPDALDKIRAIRGCTFHRNDIDSDMAGVIAQEVQAVLPVGVSNLDEETLSVDPMAVIALLVQAVKELTAKVEELERAANHT